MSDDDYDFDMHYQSSDTIDGSSNSDAKHELEALLQAEYEQYSCEEQEDDLEQYYDVLLEGHIGEAEEWDEEQQEEQQEEIQKQVELFAGEGLRVEQEYQRRLEQHLEEEPELVRLAQLYFDEHEADQDKLYDLFEAEYQWALGSYMGELEIRDAQAAEENAKMVELQAEYDKQAEEEFQYQLEQHLELERERHSDDDVWDREIQTALDYDQLLRNLEEQRDEELQELAEQYYEQEEGAEQYLRAQERQARLEDCSSPPPLSSDPMRPDCTCVICYNKLADTVLLPCGHLLACSVPSPPIPRSVAIFD